MRLTLALSISLLSAFPAMAMDYQVWVAGKNDPLVQAEFYGIAQGMSWTNAMSAIKGHPLYCVPDAIYVTPEQYADILSRYVEGVPPAGTGYLEPTLVVAMQKAFPCPKV